MKKVVVLLSLVVFLSISCAKKEQEPEVANVNFTPCQQTRAKSAELSGGVNVEFTSEGVKITHFNFEVTCDFTAVDVTHTFVNGVLHITQQSSPSHADCVCYTDVSYTINGISQDEVNVIFVNGMQVYCWNDNNQSNCDQYVIICQSEYESAPNDLFEITNMEITGNCLKIKFWASGCDGSTWVVKLIGFGNYDKSNPPQTTLRLSLEDNEDCSAIIEKEISFNLEPLLEYFRHHGTNKLYLNISGEGILYEY